jgi:hypothetical protein
VLVSEISCEPAEAITCRAFNVDQLKGFIVSPVTSVVPEVYVVDVVGIVLALGVILHVQD